MPPLEDSSVDCTTLLLERRHLSKTDNGKLRVQGTNSEVLQENSQTGYSFIKQAPWVLKIKNSRINAEISEVINSVDVSMLSKNFKFVH